MDKRRFGTFINLLRKEKGLTQKEMAEMLHVTDKAVSRWETGKSYPDIEVMQQLAEYYDVTVNELLQGERIAEEKIKTVSDRNIISVYKRLKQDKQKHMAVVAILSALIVVLGCVLVNPVGDFIQGVKTTKLEIPSKDTEAILACVDGYITAETGGPAGLYEVDIMMYGDKSIENMHIDGASINGTTFFCSVSQDLETFPYVYIHEDRNEVPGETHINTENIKGFINAADLSEFDDRFSVNARYDITLVEMSDEDYAISTQNGNKKYMYDPGKEKFRELDKGDFVKGPYALISVFKYDENGAGESLADIYWPVELQSDYYIVNDGKGNYTDSYGNSANNIEGLIRNYPAVSRLVMAIEDEMLEPDSYTEIKPLKEKPKKIIYPELTVENNSVCILTKDDGSGWTLKKGDSLVYEFEKEESIIVDNQTLLVGIIQDGVMKEGVVFRENDGVLSVTAEEDGEYFVYLLSASSEYQTIREGTMKVD